MITSEGENLVFIFSLPRSGSTLLSFLLGGHSEVYCPPEPWFLLKLVNLTSRADCEGDFDDVLATIGTEEFLDGSSLFEAAGAFALTAYNRKLASAGKSIFVDKTPRYYHILDAIEAIFPKAKKIWLKRNPLDIAYSYRTTWDMGADVITGERFTSHTLDFGVGLFRLADYFENESAYKIQIKYEDIVSSPVESLKILCDFLGIAVESQMATFAENSKMIEEHKRASMGDVKIFESTSIHADSVDKGLANFSREDLEQILSVFGLKIFDRMGYGNVSKLLLKSDLQLPTEGQAADKRATISGLSVDSVSKLNDKLHACEVELQANISCLRAIQSSLSWRITKPLRWCGNLIRRL